MNNVCHLLFEEEQSIEKKLLCKNKKFIDLHFKTKIEFKTNSADGCIL